MLRVSLLAGLLGLMNVSGACFAQTASLEALLARDENAYTRQLQERLSQRGYYSGAANGLMGEGTLRAVLSFCRDNGLAAICSEGPLTAGSARALDAALAGGSAADAASEAQPTGRETILPVSGWVADQKDGLTIEIMPRADNAALVRITGTPAAAGFANINFSDPLPLESFNGGQPSFSVDASVEPSGLGGLTGAVVRTAGFAADGYKGEVVAEGIPITGESALRRVAGAAPEGAAMVRPYVQVTFEAGTPIDATFTLQGAKVGNGVAAAQ